MDGIIDIKLNENSSFKLNEIKSILYQILLAVFNMERRGLALRFLEPKRILVSDDNKIKLHNFISDFLYEPAKLKFIQYLKYFYILILRNFKYLSPELIFFPESIQSTRSLIWSIGIICLEMLMNIKKFNSYQNLFYFYVIKKYLIFYLYHRIQMNI